MVKTQMIVLFFKMLATAVPISVSVLAFLVYVAQGKELTVGIAFTVCLWEASTLLQKSNSFFRLSHCLQLFGKSVLF